MGIIPTLNTFVAGTPIVASAMNSNFDAIVAVVNGGLDDSNISQISASKVTSGEFDLDRIPNLPEDKLPRLSVDKLPRAAQGFLKATGTGTNPTYALVQWGDVQAKPSTFPPAGHTHSAGDLNSGRLDLARLPTSAAANRFLKVGTANSTPAYSTVTWGDVQSKPSTFPPAGHTHGAGDITSGTFDDARIPSLDASKITSGTFSAPRLSALFGSGGTAGTDRVNINASRISSGTFNIARIPTGSTNNTQVAPGQAMTGSGNAQHPVGSIRLLTRSGSEGNISAGSTYSSNLYIPILSINSEGAWTVGLASEGRPPGTWQALNHTAGTVTGRNPLFLAVRIS